MRRIKMKQHGSLILAVLTATLSFQNCSGFRSASGKSARDLVLSRKVFVTMSETEDASGTIRQPGSTTGTVIDNEDCLATGNCAGATPPVSDSSGSVGQPGDSRTPTPSEQPPWFVGNELNLPVHYICSQAWTEEYGTNVTNTQSMSLLFVDSTRKIACEITPPNLREEILTRKRLYAPLSMNTCPQLKMGRYDLFLIKSGRNPSLESTTDYKKIFKNNMLTSLRRKKPNNEWSYFKVDVTKEQSGEVKIKSATGLPAEVLRRKEHSDNKDLCWENRSPLVVQLTPKPRKVRLTSQAHGVKFDLLGSTDSPQHTPRQISWFGSGDAVSHYFITLPDYRGRVDGIDQMFGDSTLGPDTATAANGYEALRKWDGRNANGTFNPRFRDGIIDQNDLVFHRLRLWSDRNTNGIAETVELFSADELGIIKIDLNYDPNYSETDYYGNQIKMKSTVETRDGGIYLMYDIWFSWLDATLPSLTAG